MSENEAAPQRNPLLRIAGLSTALGLGFMAASMQAFTRDAQGFQFRISVFTGIAFVAGAYVGWQYWRLVIRMITESANKPTRRFILFSAFLLLATVGSYFYRLRFVPRSQVLVLQVLA